MRKRHTSVHVSYRARSGCWFTRCLAVVMSNTHSRHNQKPFQAKKCRSRCKNSSKMVSTFPPCHLGTPTPRKSRPNVTDRSLTTDVNPQPWLRNHTNPHADYPFFTLNSVTLLCFQVLIAASVCTRSGKGKFFTNTP